MSTHPALERLRSILIESHALGSASALLSWDQETMMPKQGIEGRADVLAQLAGLAHERFVRAETAAALEQLEAARSDLDDDALAIARETRKDYDRATKVPKELVTAIAQAQSLGQDSWQRARAAADFAMFAPSLERLVDLKRAYAHAVNPNAEPFDVLLDDHEADMSTDFLDTLFSALKARLVPMVEAIASSAVVIDTGPLRRALPLEKQLAFARSVTAAMGFDDGAGRVDRSAHPFCIGIHPGDVRLTWRGQTDDLRPALYGLMHEAGHGLYEQGLPAAWVGTPLASAVSLGIHESQSRLWENMIGRSRAFWTAFLPRLKAAAPGVYDDVDVDAMTRAANEVEPSLIRVEADELTYNLHIVIRFEIERDLFRGRLRVRDLPEAWDAAYATLLGIRPPDAARGVLQDVHWSMGAFGYFPTYTLGNLYAAQFLERAREELGDLDGAIARGDFLPLRDWLRERIHRHGRKYPPRELVRRVTGRDPEIEPFLRHVESKFMPLYRG
ncbi:MAG: carboxypeptidase M32 [Planctomycetes bacterium]|nr:carboxypeptidase M32 [Planctomycetota bacterium]MCC7171346.1 carboxypeptidase M32 [Planctomycetota bacterium]